MVVSSHSDDLRVKEIKARWAYVREQFDKNTKNKVEVLEEYILDLEKRISETICDSYTGVSFPKSRNKRKSSWTSKNAWRIFKLTSSALMSSNRSFAPRLKRPAERKFKNSRRYYSVNQNQNDWETNLGLQIEEKFNALGSSFQKTKNLHNETLEQQVSEINNGLVDIKESILEEKKQREDGSEQIVAKVQTDLIELENRILEEQKVRELTFERLKEEILETEAFLDKAIQTETKNRENTNNQLFTLLDEQCSRIERSFTSGF